MVLKLLGVAALIALAMVLIPAQKPEAPARTQAEIDCARSRPADTYEGKFALINAVRHIEVDCPDVAKELNR